MRWPWQKRDTAASEVTKALPAGDGGFASTAPVPPPTKPAGSDGVAVFGGFVVAGERSRALDGAQKWVTYDNATLNIAIVASAINVWTQLGGSAKWTAEPNKRGGRDADRGVQIVTEGLFEAPMSTPWRQVVRRQLMKKFRGFALHEAVIRRRSDGMVVIADLLDRPQWSINRWNKPDEQSAWLGVEQITHNGRTPYIPRERLFYSAENTLSPTPAGVGLLRQLAESVRVLELYQQWEGIGFQTDLRGMPIGRAPLGKLMQQAGANKTEHEIRAFLQAETKFLVDFLMGHNKRADQGIMLDSSVYTGKDQGQTPSSVYEWNFDLVKGASSSMPEVGAAIGRLVQDIARVLCAEWLLLGGGDSGGAYSMHEDKTAMFGLVVNSALDDIADDTTRDLATRLVALNGLDPETCTPRVAHEPIATAAVKDACQSLMMMTQAALDPRDKAINILRDRMDLPPAPEIDETDEALRAALRAGVRRPPGDSGPRRPTGGSGGSGGSGEAGNPNARPGAGDKRPTKETA